MNNVINIAESDQVRRFRLEHPQGEQRLTKNQLLAASFAFFALAVLGWVIAR